MYFYHHNRTISNTSPNSRHTSWSAIPLPFCIAYIHSTLYVNPLKLCIRWILVCMNCPRDGKAKSWENPLATHCVHRPSNQSNECYGRNIWPPESRINVKKIYKSFEITTRYVCYRESFVMWFCCITNNDDNGPGIYILYILFTFAILIQFWCDFRFYCIKSFDFKNNKWRNDM